MRNFTYITVGKILSELKKEGVTISRPTFYRIERKLGFPAKDKSSGSWRVYTPQEADEVKNLIKSNYKIEMPSPSVFKAENSLDYLEKLYHLKERGIVTDEEFEAKKKQILGI